ncbi:hypothetical protein SAMN05216387_11828 [Nitrosovibrio tenuis]|uniref:Uncharacterized protein n=1 Tax=Nitrosovibrio tenuis TaxID=1233 RepID=A0A1H7RN44_9PROT|nr:hypothetical protein SAMN05216387_11828 [Nitrosovibrio tenuis]
MPFRLLPVRLVSVRALMLCLPLHVSGGLGPISNLVLPWRDQRGPVTALEPRGRQHKHSPINTWPSPSRGHTCYGRRTKPELTRSLNGAGVAVESLEEVVAEPPEEVAERLEALILRDFPA